MKGTPSMGKKSRHKLHFRCRRCGKLAYHKSTKICSSCGFGKSKRMRHYKWEKPGK